VAYLSALLKNVLYIGHNVQLVEALLNSISAGDNTVSYRTKHVLNSNEVLIILGLQNFHYLISEKPIHQSITDQIKNLYPNLHCTYLKSSELALSEIKVMPTKEALISDEVKNALNCISIPIYYKNKDGVILVCNHSFSSQLGLTNEQIIGKHASEILPESLQKDIEIIDKKVFETRQVHLYKCNLHDLNGNRHEVVFRKELIPGSDIQIGMIFDITELNEAKREIEKERIMLRATADISSDLLFFKDLDSRFLGCNKQFEKFTGQPESEILGHTDEQFFDIEQARMCQQQDKDVMDNNEIYSGEEYLTYNDGERHFIDMRKVPLLDNEGKVQGLIGIGRDITAHHRLQKRLKVANAVFENSQENLIVTDQAGIIISVNLATCLLTGYKKAELLGNSILEFSTQEGDSTLHQRITEGLENNNQWRGNIIYRNKQKELRFAWLDVYNVELEKRVNNRIYSFTDLTQNKNIESKIQYLSKHDPLTGLSNRIALFTTLEDAINRANFNEMAMAVILVDINSFKAINDQYGHDAGDKVLQEIASRLKKCICDKDTVARFGDDEFVIIIDDLKNEHDAALVAQKVTEQFLEKFNIGDIAATLSATIGISLCPDDGIDINTLLQSAEKAMLRAKLDKNNAYHFYTNQLTEHSSYQLQLEAELKIAIKNDQFEIYYQPQYDLNKKLIVAMESLLRWNHPQHGLLLPERFISLAEESGLLIPIGLKMIKEVALQVVKWKKTNICFGRIAINISATQLSQISLIADIQSILKDTGCHANDIEFEVVESIFETNNYTIIENLLNIRKLGIAITVDGFGSDLAIFHFLEPLGIEKFKIAQHYIHGVPGRIVGEAMIKSIIVLARELGVDVVGAGIESAEQEEFLIANQISSGQGDHKYKPMKASEATFHLRCHKKK
jgi:diguanylate cyclase (GGDEF)-like protein/PAS domain S-box-containing protein